MSREIAAIVAPAVDEQQVRKRISSNWIALQDCERIETSKREEGARRRIEIGRDLIQLRKQWPSSGPNAAGWGKLLEGIGIPSQRASEFMRLAGYADSVPPENQNSGGNKPPTQADAGIDKKPRKGRKPRVVSDGVTQPDPPDEGDEDKPDDPASDWAKEMASRKAPPQPTIDIDAELASLNNKLVKFARACATRDRRALAHELKVIIQMIEEMDNE